MADLEKLKFKYIPIKKCPGRWSCHWCWKVVIQNGSRSNFSWLAHSYNKEPITSSYLLSLLSLRSSWTKAVEKQLTPGSLENDDKSSDDAAVRKHWVYAKSCIFSETIYQSKNKFTS